ncbi:MAG TPA: FtsH protease activity modulator HflK [Methylococcaceae bacterium]|nr:FtsH protease activity modulator HflK [Methylococcaceae bacterium]
MSWNEPGGNKKDPWSGRERNKNGESDLEQVLRSMQERLGGLWRGGGDGGRGFGAPSANWGLIGSAAVAVWALTGVYIVDEGNRAVVTRFGKYVETTLPGPHWHIPAPIEAHALVNVEKLGVAEVGYRSTGVRQQQSSSIPKEALMLTRDENIVDVRLAVQYQIKEAKDYLFNVLDPDVTLKQVTESATRAAIGKSNMDFVLTEGRGEVADAIKREIQQIMDDYRTGFHISSVNLVDAQPPDEVQGAFEDAIKAREDEQRLKNEAEAYANEVVPKARGVSARLMQEAEGYKQKVVSRATGETSRFGQMLSEYEKAPEVTRKRLYLDAMESVMSGSQSILVDVKSGNNLLYLPLDKLAPVAVPPPEDASAARSETATPAPAPTPTQPGDAGSGRGWRTLTRGRETR